MSNNYSNNKIKIQNKNKKKNIKTKSTKNELDNKSKKKNNLTENKIDNEENIINNLLKKKKKNQLIIDNSNLKHKENDNGDRYFTLDINEDNDYIIDKNPTVSHHIKNRLPWIEKYRPSSLDDLILCPIMKNKINNIINSKILPNMILTGSPCTGKTSTVLCLAKKIIGAKYKDNIL